MQANMKDDLPPDALSSHYQSAEQPKFSNEHGDLTPVANVRHFLQGPGRLYQRTHESQRWF